MNLKFVFPKNITQSFVFILIIIITQLATFLFFEALKIDFNYIITIKTFFAYLLSFIVLHKIARNKKTNYPLRRVNVKLVFLLAILTITFSFSIGVPSFYWIHNMISIENINTINDSILIPIILTNVVIAPVFEELIIRGIMFKGLIRNNTLLKAILITTFFFTLIHFDLSKTPSLIISSFFLCWLYYKTKNLTLTIITHSLYNFLSIFIPYFIFVDNKYIYGKYTILIILSTFICFFLTLYYVKEYFLNIIKINVM